MRAHPFKIGILATLAGICAWSLEWWIGFPFLFPIVFGAQYVALIALVFCVRQLAPSLFRSWWATFTLWLMLSAASIAALFAVIPFRLWMPEWANDGHRRWFYEGMPQPENTYAEWLADWQSFGPHYFEAKILAAFFAILLLPCFLFRIRGWGAAVVCLLGYLLLAMAPLYRGLLAPDYDMFHLGIALDSIALSIWPFGLACLDAHCIYTLGFFAIVFTIGGVFLATPLARRNVSPAPDGVQG